MWRRTVAERRRPNARTRARQRRSYQPGLPQALRGAAPSQGTLTEPQLLERWKRRVAQAQKLRRDWEDEYQVPTLERFYLGKHTSLDGTGDDRADIYLNHFAATLQAQRPALLPTKLTFDVQPKPGKRDVERLMVKAQAGVLDTIAQQDGHLMKSLRLAATQAFFRVGVLKVCYEPRLEPNPEKGQPLLNDLDQALLGPGGAPLTQPAQILDDEVWRWRWVNARNLLLPDEGPDTTRWTWIGEEVEVTLEEAQDDPLFPEAKRAQLKGNGRARDWERWGQSDTSDLDERDQQVFRYYECWDRRQEKRYIWADGQDFDGFLVHDDYPDGVEEHPYALLLPVPILEPEPSPWPKPLCFDWLPIQQQYNLLRVQQLNAGKRAARKILYDEATFPNADEAQKFLESSIDMQGVKVNDIGRPPLVVGDGAQSIDVSRNIPYLLADWQRVTGATGTRLGDPNADTATEAVLASQSEAVRDSELRTLVGEWLTEAGQKMLQLVKQTLTLDLWIDLKDLDDTDFQDLLTSEGFQAYLALRVGAENVPRLLQMVQVMPGMAQMLKQRFGQVKPLRVSRSHLQMDSDVSVVPSTMRPIYRAQLLQLTQILGPAALLSPTLLEELLHSFELPQGDRIAEEIIGNLRQQALMQQMAQMQKQGGAGPMPGARPQPQSAASPLQTQNPLSVVAGGRGL
jgi:hypothetical protein